MRRHYQHSARRSMLFLASGAILGLAIAAFGLFSASGTRTHSVPPEDLALVNNRPILRSDFITQVQTQFGRPFAQSTPEQRARVLQDMLFEELKVQRGLELDLPSFDPDVRVAMAAGVELEASANVMAQQPTDLQLRAFYLAHQDKYLTEGTLMMRDLVAHSEAFALQAAAALRSGVAIDQVLTRYQLVDSGRLMQGGRVDVGEVFEFAARAKLGPDLYAVAAALRAGQISAPILLSDGVHIIVMMEHHLPVQRDYVTVADQVWADFKSDAQAQVRAANLQFLRQRADILLSDDAKTIERQRP